ncbi:MAG: hypothetical protein JRI68_12020 [Deltaproteobacteria bacterium]|nr:hypothetical protein [Deltaproteobacteria bacterium]
MTEQKKPAWGILTGALGSGALWALLASGGCVAIADIGDIEFGPSTGGAGGTGTGGGTGGTTSSSGTGGDAGSGGGSSCDDNEQNGQETGIDCGGPDCPECAEDCTNGEDDDGDNLVDCADPLCSGYHCAAAVPNGWSGPAAFYLGDSATALPTCDVAWPTETSGDAGAMSAPPASCGACGCNAPSGETCGVPSISIWLDPDCPGSANAVLPTNAPNSCLSFGGNSNDSFRVSIIPVTGGSCATTSGTPTIDPPSFAEAARVCDGATLGSCHGSTEVCVRIPDSPFQAQVCVSQSGDVPCPAQDYTEKRLVVLGVTDTRSCSACTCDPPTGATCSGTTAVWTNQSCSQSPVTVPNDGATCINHPGGRSVEVTGVTGPTGGTCASGGGQPTGTATVADTLTVCCLPE